MLPPRAQVPPEASALPNALVSAVDRFIANYDLLPTEAELVRAPRGAFTTRPAALLAFADRLVLEALVEPVEAALEQRLPAAVLWPRSRALAPPVNHASVVLEWDSPYVVKADIAQFYESVEHSLLGVFLSSELDLPSPVSRAVEAVLSATMRLPRGLPQGPLASDILASAYLLPIDVKLAGLDRPYVRYADDYYFPAADVGDGRLVLQRLEAWLNELGLALNAEKTSVMRMTTFAEGLERRAVRALKERYVAEALAPLGDEDGADDVSDVLVNAGVPDETLWDLMYHQTVTLEDVADQLIDADTDRMATAYGMYFRRAAQELRGGDLDQPTIGAIAGLVFECLVLLAGTDVEVAASDLEEVQLWYPHLTPQVVDYLTSPRHVESDFAARYVSARLSAPSSVDWVDAWMCHGAGRLPPASFPLLLVRALAADSAAGPLTTAEAIRALAQHRVLERADWTRALSRLRPAVAAEMVFSSLSAPQRLPWLRAASEATQGPGVATLLQAADESAS